MQNSVRGSGRWLFWSLVGSVSVLVGCAAPTQPAQRAPVVERSAAGGAAVSAAPAVAAHLPGAENAGRPGFYTVRPGDTLIRIGLETGQSWRDLAAWNGLTNPDRIEVGQVLRVIPPVATTVAAAPVPAQAGAASAPVADSGAATTTTRPVGTASAQGRPLTDTTAPPPAAAPAPAAPPAPTPPAVATAPAAAENINFVWPARGPVVDTFDEVRNKGIGIAGRAGDPVLAAADGRVVYAGSGLRGYGNLVILKHNNTFLTAYAHNQAILVREDQTVRQGQQIAEMGSSDSDRVKLHFEIRRQGRPVDPMRHLPAR